MGESESDRDKKIGVAVVVATVIVVGILGVFFISIGHTAWIEYDVTSTHITEDVDVIVYVDGKEVAVWRNLHPGQEFHNTKYYGYRFSIFDSHKLIEVKAVSTGGGLGSQIDSEKIIVENGGRYTVRLRV